MRSVEKLKSIEFTRTMFLVLSGHSGVGKTTIRELLIESLPESGFSISVTTREKREHERDGRDYNYISYDEFKKLIDTDGLLEYEEVHGNYYGTLMAPADEALKKPGLMVFDVDVYGGVSIKERFPESVLIFLRPPDLEELRKRLVDRKTENTDLIQRRLDRIPKELELKDKYDHIVTNSDLEDTMLEIAKIIEKYNE